MAFPPERIGEEAFTTWVIDVARLHGWSMRYHTHDSRRAEKGFPDWVLIHPGAHRVVFAELKGHRTTVTAEQRMWLAELNRCGVRAFLWRPRDAPQVWQVLSQPYIHAPPMMQP